MVFDGSLLLLLFVLLLFALLLLLSMGTRVFFTLWGRGSRLCISMVSLKWSEPEDQPCIVAGCEDDSCLFRLVHDICTMGIIISKSFNETYKRLRYVLCVYRL